MDSSLVGSSSIHFSEASEAEVQEATFCAGTSDTNSGAYLGFLKGHGVLVGHDRSLGLPQTKFSNRKWNAALERVNAGNRLPMLKPLFLDKLAV